MPESLHISQVSGESPSAANAGAFNAADGIIFAVILIFICAVIWLSNREIRISRIKSRDSEKFIESERISLEQKISERTAAFVQAEEQRLAELERNAEFGKLSQGLFHDLISPLSSVSLYAQNLDKKSVQNYSAQEKEMIQTVINSSKRMNSFMDSVKRSLGSGAVTERADLGKEIEIVRDILSYKARMAGVPIIIQMPKGTKEIGAIGAENSGDSIILPIQPVRLHQLILNLVSNAIDACADKPDSTVTISVVKKLGALDLSVSDTGSGISKENQARLFKDQFTTKKGGTGIGLKTVKTIVQKDLGGTIEVKSEEGKGTEFVVRIPTNLKKYLSYV